MRPQQPNTKKLQKMQPRAPPRARQDTAGRFVGPGSVRVGFLPKHTFEPPSTPPHVGPQFAQNEQSVVTNLSWGAFAEGLPEQAQPAFYIHNISESQHGASGVVLN